MKTQGPFTLSDDRPKENPWIEDRLGFRPFAERLAKVVLGLCAPNGYVIGLHGEWGSGKSTALNFIKAILEKHNQEAQAELDRICVIDFRPWMVSGHQDLVGAFFKVLSENVANKKDRRRKKWRRALRWFRSTTDPLLDAVAKVGIVADPSTGVASGTVVKVAKTSLNQMIDRFLDDPSLQAAYDALRKSLVASGKKFFVTIDDLDRLERPEIRSIMQMVKTVGQLPNVIYLLAYDRAIVWAALDEGISADGGRPSFAEKIIQQEVELPSPEKEALLRILDSELEFLIGSTRNDVRWHYIVRDGVRRWMRHPRDVMRLSNAVKFSWPALKGEIDPQDLFAMEGLRLFDPIAFDWVRWNRDFLFTEGRFRYSTNAEREAVGKAVRDCLPERTREQTLWVLIALFPSQEKWITGTRLIGDEPDWEIVKRRGIGSPAGYDAYFSLFPSPNAIPKATIDAVMEKLSDEEFLVSGMSRKNCSSSSMQSCRNSSPSAEVGTRCDTAARMAFSPSPSTPSYSCESMASRASSICASKSACARATVGNAEIVGKA
jgi:predicted KAP-like P-loop ATPase